MKVYTVNINGSYFFLFISLIIFIIKEMLIILKVPRLFILETQFIKLDFLQNGESRSIFVHPDRLSSVKDVFPFQKKKLVIPHRISAWTIFTCGMAL